ncbi:MAG: GP88 family protein [Cetobacterium sp.]
METKKIKKEKLHITIHSEKHKLRSIVSINTSTLCNSFCNKMADRSESRKDRECKTICDLCYAEKITKLFPSLENKLIKNSEILSKGLIEVPFLNYAFVRFHSFGEIINKKHMENIYNIAKANPQATFCLMTKRYDLAMKFEKLDNVVYIASAPMINVPIVNKKVLNYFDKQFVVYDVDKAEEQKIELNCKGKSCVDCRQCYTKLGDKVITEGLRK